MVADDDLIAALRKHGSHRKAAIALGLNARTVDRRVKRLAMKGYSPAHDMTHAVPDGFTVKGVSTLYTPDGGIAAQWVKSQADAERQRELMEAACKAMTDDLPKLPPRKAKGVWNRDLLTVYPIGDPHIGMLSYPPETGEAWDLEIAERVHCAAMAALVESAPASETGLVVNLGDALHYDSMIPRTPEHGNFLDADGRYSKMIRVGVKIIRQCIESALTKHKNVRVINVIGNHDEIGALWLSLALSQVYEREPRVTVDTSPALFNYYRFGKVLIGCHHGHKCKPDKLAGVMAADRAKDWGECTHRYWLTGHVHHASFQEFPGVTVESFGTLAAKDAYAAGNGYRSRRSMTAIVMHRENGEVARSMVTPEMLERAA